jgi:indolepyruvate ferredoxin oxidoreductase alpha subunit
MVHPLLADTPGETHLLLGNEAIVRGALEAGIGFISCYPGTPSSEAPDTFFKLAPQAEYYFEYSVNEKVALEVGGGAALAGVPTLVTMKHVGVNVAADPLMSLAYVGTPGGLVLLSADDPAIHSSQNEQDNRYFARLAGFPCFEPSTAQEAKDMLIEALSFSRKWEQPVMLRTTTRINHLRGPVQFGPMTPITSKGTFNKNPQRFVLVPAVARNRHQTLLNNLTAIQEDTQDYELNKQWGQGKLGIITSGICRAYVKDCLFDMELEDQVQVLELGFTYPLAEQKIVNFISNLDQVLIVEELEPILEKEVRALAQREGLSIQVLGKSEALPRFGEFCTRNVKKALNSLLPNPQELEQGCETEDNLPQRPPNLCAGCSHRATYFAVRKVFGDEAVYSSDIGCYTLGILPPLRTADFLFCMGSSISGGSGMARASDGPVVAFIGDSTFFHSGLTGLVNAMYNEHNLLIVVLDNKTTAMTGHQPHPGVDQTVHGENPSRVDLEQVVRGCGVQHVRKVKPFNHKSTLQALEELKSLSGVRVLISEEPCTLFARRMLGKKPGQVAYVAEDHPDVRSCAEQLGCPAFYLQGENMRINEDQCTGCMLCVQVSPYIKARKRSGQ